ncbi:MAG: chitobiase/beta-hexosaminidase C-terminal domain-containing protein, partial [Parcubacteria group bacterium]
SSGVDSCMTAANPTAAAAGYWDDGNYGSCGTNNRPTCVNGSHQILLGDTETTGGGVKYHTACVLPNTVSEVVATPTATPVAGTYTSAQSVTLATTTTASYPNGVYIYYTTDGSTPTTASTPYTAPIIISSTTTLKAIAIKTARSGFTTSAVLTALYTIGSGSPYSCTGSDPANATLCSGDDTALTADTAKNLVSTCGTPKCEFSCNSGYALSSGGMCSINIPPVATPTATPVAGTYTSAQSVTLATTTSGATIYYTLDGSTPSSFSTQYSTAIAISATITLKAIAVKSGMTDSAVLTALYTINIPPQVVAAPTANPAAGTYTSAQSVTLAATTTGATIYYTTNGSDPTTSSAQYASAITISSTTTLKAIAVRSGMTNSSIMTAVYTITPLVVATPTATSPAGTYTSAQNVTLSTSTAGAIIRYTLDNTTPTINSTMYTVPVAISATKTLKAIAIKTGMTNSGILTAAYTINEQQVATPTASPAPGTYDGEKNVSLSTATSGASVYYTTNGSTPTSSSSLFGSPIKITKDTTIKAIAVKTGMTNSNVMTAVYKIKDSIKNSKYYKYYKYYRDRYHNKTGKADYLKVRDIRRHNMAQYVEMKNIYLIYKGLSKNELKELDVVTLKKFYIFKHYNGYKNYLNYRKKVGA